MEMVRIAENARKENRLSNAAIYYRSAEFFSELFYEAFRNDRFERSRVPYQGSFLPAAIRTESVTQSIGTILLHGGMDSFVEEWYLMMKFLADAGYDSQESRALSPPDTQFIIWKSPKM